MTEKMNVMNKSAMAMTAVTSSANKIDMNLGILTEDCQSLPHKCELNVVHIHQHFDELQDNMS